MLMKRASNEKECRGLTLSRRRPSTSGSNSNEAARLPQPITASRKVETRDNRKKRHRPGRINFGAITPAAPERKTPEPLLFVRCQSPFRSFPLDAVTFQRRSTGVLPREQGVTATLWSAAL
jgi:hypothetical protein